MATTNTLTALIPTLYQAADIVLREAIGFIPAVTLAPSAARAALNQSVDVPISRALPAEDIVPGVTPPSTGGQTIDKTQITVTKSQAVPFLWTGEDQRQVDNGPGYENLRRSQVAQAFRTLANNVETTLAGLYIRSSRAYGTSGTTPFASSVSELAQVRKILVDNGASPTELQAVIDTTAGANLRSLSQLTKANEAADTTLLRQGLLSSLSGFDIRESAAVVTTTKGTGTGYLADGAHAIGATSILLKTGSGTAVAGDYVTFAGDTNKYMVATGISAPGTIVLAAPGLRKTLADGVAMTIGNSYAANMCFDRNAILLATRLPERPREGDLALDVMPIVDPRTGITFEVSMYGGYRQVRFEIALAWGAQNIRPEASAILLG